MGMSLETSLIMFILFLSLGMTMLYRIKLIPDADQLFSKENTCALRGFWSIIILLVHVPEAFQNSLQDMAGSFAYIGVTFFFMTSAYGLKLTSARQGIDAFWRRRLPKLLIPVCCINIIAMLVRADYSISRLISFPGWVQWLLYCYVIFWIVYKTRLKHKDWIICICIVLLSLYWFAVKSAGWPTEIYGFIWGILLANNRVKLSGPVSVKRWLVQCAGMLAIAAILGKLYLDLKPVVFWGNYLLKICLGAALILLLLWITKMIRISNKANQFLGKISYETYLLHSMVMTTIARAKLNMESALFILVSVVCTLVLAALVNWISTNILKRITL